MKLRDANLHVYEKNSFMYLPSFSKNASQFLSKRLLKCVSKISSRKYKQKVTLLVVLPVQ